MSVVPAVPRKSLIILRCVSGLILPFVLTLIAALLSPVACGQETTGGLQGTVKDTSSAVVPGAHIEVRGTSLVGSKTLDTDASGYYHFANLPPGTYSITVSAKNFKTEKREKVNIEVGHLPTLDITLEVGTATEVVEVTEKTALIDVTTNTNQTNVTSDVLQNVPLEGRSFQSVIQFAPMARNEPLAGLTTNGMGMGGTGGSLPGSSGNGLAYGYSVGGGADSENQYLVEGQDTENISGGYSKANVPFQFIQEVQIKSSGIEAEHGGALGGVVNVVMKKGGNSFHGQLFATYEANGLDADNNIGFLRYDPTSTGNAAQGLDPTAQIYVPKEDHFKIVQPGFTLGGPIAKDRLWFFIGFAPQINSLARTVDFTASNIANNSLQGKQYFTHDSQLYYGTARLDFVATQKIRLFASWLDQYSRSSGVNLPLADPIPQEPGYLNSSINTPISAYSHGIGYAAPNSTYNFGADISLTPRIVSTTRFGYFFENYHDFGWQTTTPDLFWFTPGTASDNTGAPVPTSLVQPSGYQTAPFNMGTTAFNANKHYQLNEDVAFFKSGWAGTHNVKIGYQLNRMTNSVFQDGNVPFVYMVPSAGAGHSISTVTGAQNCATLTAQYGLCAGQYGYAWVQDFATILPQVAGDWNHALFLQDAWTVGHGLTFNLGLRVEKESLPVPGGLQAPGVVPPTSINFSWTDKLAPRLGVAWDVMRNGKMKVFGSYGVTNDVMKLLLAQTSWGAQGFEDCFYALGPDGTSAGFTAADIDPVFVNNRACPNAAATVGANFASGITPPSLIDPKTGVSLIENVDLRPWEPVAPGVKPYRQHEFVAGMDYQIVKDWAFEARYDRRRLDHVIEDASLADPNNFEMYTVVNPGEGVNSTIDGYANYLHSLGPAFGVPQAPGGLPFEFNPTGAFGTCPSCPANPKAIRNYDGVELRFTKSTSHGWAGMFSYTWSSLWGNYTGLTTTDQVDGGAAGRNSPDTTRSFDEPFYYFGANGLSNAGPLPTDRPNTFKGNVYYQLPWKRMTTTFGLFQVAYQGSPMSTSTDLFLTSNIPFEDVYVFGRGKWANITQDPTTGNLTVGTPYSRRTPWFTQTDFNLQHLFKVNRNNEAQVLSFEATVTNLLNQHSVTQFWQSFDSNNFFTALNVAPATGPNAINFGSGAALYNLLEHGYNVQQWINGNGGLASPVIKSSQYGQPFAFQLLRNMRLGVSFSF